MTLSVVRNIPPIDLPIQETSERIIQSLQKKFAEQGYLRGLVSATLDQCVEQELSINEEILLTYIKDNWSVYFPGVEESDTNLAQARDLTQHCLQTMKADIRAKLMQYLTDTDVQSDTQRPRYQSLVIPPTELNVVLRKPCRGGAHRFSDAYNFWIRSAVRSRWRKRERSSWFRCCGRGMLQDATVDLVACDGCGCVYKRGETNLIMYCDNCGRYRSTRDICFTSYIFFSVLCLSLGVVCTPTRKQIRAVLEAHGMYKDVETGLIMKL